eukprot:gene9802-13189_t
MSQQNNNIIVANAIPVKETKQSNTVVYAVGSQLSTSPPSQQELMGTCRKCGRQFQRSPEFHDGQAQYYRCPECFDERWTDIFVSSCVIS